MAFVVRKLTEEEGKKYNIPENSDCCAIDAERNAVLWNKGGGGRNDSPDDHCEFHWKEHVVTFRTPKSRGKNQQDKMVVHWPIKHLNIPIGLRGQEPELKQLMKEAIIACGWNGLNHLPAFKYDILVIDNLENERFTYIAR